MNDKTPKVEKNNHSISYLKSLSKKGGSEPDETDTERLINERKRIGEITGRTLISREESREIEKKLQEMSAKYINSYRDTTDYAENNKIYAKNNDEISSLIKEIKDNNNRIKAREIAKIAASPKIREQTPTRKRGGSESDISTGSKHNTPPSLLATVDRGLMDQFRQEMTVKADEVKEKMINAIRKETEKKLKSKYMDEKIKYLKKNIFKDANQNDLKEIAEQSVDEDLENPYSAISLEIEKQTYENMENNELFKKMIDSIDNNDPTSSATAVVNTATRGIQDNILHRAFRVQQLDDLLEKVNNIEELQIITRELENLKKFHDDDLENVEFSKKKKKIKSTYLSSPSRSMPKSKQGRQSRIKDMMEQSEMYQQQSEIKNSVIDQSTKLHEQLKNEESLFNEMFSKINKKSIQEQSIDDLMQNLGLDDETNSPSLKSPLKKKKGKKKRWIW